MPENSSSTSAPFLSLVVPVYNEQEVIPALLQRVGAALGQLNRPFEVVIVDDGSTDSSAQLLTKGMEQFAWLRVLRMKQNSGQSAAFDAGFKAARGSIIATIDGDLQNDPDEIVRLLPLLEQCDMVTGWRKDRRDNAFRKIQTFLANGIRNWLSRETIRDSACSLKLYKRCCLEGMVLYNGMHRFMPTLVKLRGFKVMETPVKHSPRYAGKAKYGLGNRAWRTFVDLLAVRWMKKRYLRYQVQEVVARGPEAQAAAAQRTEDRPCKSPDMTSGS